jgi:hypothetical protein
MEQFLPTTTRKLEGTAFANTILSNVAPAMYKADGMRSQRAPVVGAVLNTVFRWKQ